MIVKIRDTDGHTHEVQIEGDRSLSALQTLIRTKFAIPASNRIIVKRADNKPFWTEDRWHYTLVIQYDPNIDTHLSPCIRFDRLERTYYTEDIRVVSFAENHDMSYYARHAMD
jgi:hypothetical protein